LKRVRNNNKQVETRKKADRLWSNRVPPDNYHSSSKAPGSYSFQGFSLSIAYADRRMMTLSGGLRAERSTSASPEALPFCLCSCDIKCDIPGDTSGDRRQATGSESLTRKSLRTGTRNRLARCEKSSRTKKPAAVRTRLIPGNVRANSQPGSPISTGALWIVQRNEVFRARGGWSSGGTNQFSRTETPASRGGFEAKGEGWTPKATKIARGRPYFLLLSILGNLLKAV